MRLIDADACPELFNEEFKKTRKLILEGETHLDNLAEGFTEADRVIRKMPTIDPESLRPKGHWNIRCESHHDNWTGETDEEFYLECSECKRTAWEVNQMDAMNGDYRKIVEKFPYCHCGARMEG